MDKLNAELRLYIGNLVIEMLSAQAQAARLAAELEQAKAIAGEQALRIADLEARAAPPPPAGG